MDRLDKFLSDGSGLSRSQAKAALKAGRVTVNGIPEKDGSRKIIPGEHSVCLDGTAVGKVQTVVAMLHKPAGFVTATQDLRDKTVMELLPRELQHLELKPVGRLDKETEGLLLFTNDGELLHKLIAPRYAVKKVYYARHEGMATQEDVLAFQEGLTLRDGTKCLSAVLKPLGSGESVITVQEGKYHQVRRMMASRGMPVAYLKRLEEGSLSLGSLPLGQVRLLEPEELQSLFAENLDGKGR